MKMKRRTTARSILLAAAWILERYGWCRGDYGPLVASKGRHCLVGAILAVPSPSGANSRARNRMRDEGYSESWNDRPSRRCAHVTAALRRVARAS